MKIDGTLYTMKSCPFCVRVESYLETHNIQIKIIDITNNNQKRNELIKLGGKAQVPCYVKDNSPLYESIDIINHFEDYIYDKAN